LSNVFLVGQHSKGLIALFPLICLNHKIFAPYVLKYLVSQCHVAIRIAPIVWLNMPGMKPAKQLSKDQKSIVVSVAKNGVSQC
jgi:hypothetical protein